MRARSRGPESGPLTGAPNPNCISASENGGISPLAYIAARPGASPKPSWRTPGARANEARFPAGGQGGKDDGNDAKPHKARDGAGARLFAGGHHRGGRTIWLAGQVAVEDGAGRSLAGDFDGQVREIFARLGRTLEEAGAKLADMVTMTVFITDPRLGDRFVQLRKEIFGDNFPASALITVAGLARPEMLVEVQGVAVAA